VVPGKRHGPSSRRALRSCASSSAKRSRAKRGATSPASRSRSWSRRSRSGRGSVEHSISSSPRPAGTGSIRSFGIARHTSSCVQAATSPSGARCTRSPPASTLLRRDPGRLRRDRRALGGRLASANARAGPGRSRGGRADWPVRGRPGPALRLGPLLHSRRVRRVARHVLRPHRHGASQTGTPLRRDPPAPRRAGRPTSPSALVRDPAHCPPRVRLRTVPPEPGGYHRTRDGRPDADPAARPAARGDRGPARLGP